MSANRHIPYGYRMANGQIEIHPEEAAVVRRIYQEYLDGAVLKAIAARLALEQVEYLPGECGWNKNRVKRILEDSRYTSGELYAPLVDPTTQEAANRLKESRNTQKERLMTAEKKRLSHTVLCGTCGSRMQHKTDRRLKCGESWSCSCGATVKLTIADMEQQLVELFNQAIASPDRCGYDDTPDYEPSLEIRRLENEIARQTEQPETDQDAVREQILLCAAKKYAECLSNRHITQRLKKYFQQLAPLQAFSTELYVAAADATLLYPDGTICVRLKNQTLLRKEEQHADGHEPAEENRAGNTGRPEKIA